MKLSLEKIEYAGVIFFPNGKPVPEVLTEQELIDLLRLNEDGPKDPSLTIKYYRDKGLLNGIKIGKRIRYTKQDVLKFLDEQTKWTNRKNIA